MIDLIRGPTSPPSPLKGVPFEWRADIQTCSQVLGFALCCVEITLEHGGGSRLPVILENNLSWSTFTVSSFP